MRPLWRAAACSRPGGRGSPAEALSPGDLARGQLRHTALAFLGGPGAVGASVVDGGRARQNGLAVNRVAAYRNSAHQVLSVRLTGVAQLAAAGGDHARTVARGAGLPAAERGVGTGPLRGPKLDRVAPSCHVGDDRTRLLAARTETEGEQKLPGRCPKRAVNSNRCWPPGRATVSTAGLWRAAPKYLTK